MQIITILLKSDVVPNPIISNVSISIYDQSSIFVTSGNTDSNGLFSTSLPEATYKAYFFKQGVSIAQPVTLIVSSSSKNFLVYGHLKIPNESLDNNLCCLYGYTTNISGILEDEVELVMKQQPLNIVTNSLVFNSPIRVYSDKKGYFEFYLLRNLNYEVHYEGYDEPLFSKTPSLPSLEVQNFLFPVPLNLTLSRTSITINLNDGLNSIIESTLTFTDQNIKILPYNDWSYLKYDSTNDICQIAIVNGKLVLNPQRTGTTIITFSREIKDGYIFTNLPNFTSSTLTIIIN